jgi:hypothetical protein
MSVPTSAKTVTFEFTEAEATAYYDLISARQSWSAQWRSWASLVYVPLALGALLMAVSVLRGGRGNADFGPMLVVGTIAYMAGHFAFNYEYMRQYKLQRTAQLSELFFHGARHVTLKQAALEWSVHNGHNADRLRRLHRRRDCPRIYPGLDRQYGRRDDPSSCLHQRVRSRSVCQ